MWTHLLHAFPNAVRICCTEELVFLLLRVRGVFLRHDESRKYGPSPSCCAKWGKAQSDVMPVYHLVGEVA